MLLRESAPHIAEVFAQISRVAQPGLPLRSFCTRTRKLVQELARMPAQTARILPTGLSRWTLPNRDGRAACSKSGQREWVEGGMTRSPGIEVAGRAAISAHAPRERLNQERMLVEGAKAAQQALGSTRGAQHPPERQGVVVAQSCERHSVTAGDRSARGAFEDRGVQAAADQHARGSQARRPLV